MPTAARARLYYQLYLNAHQPARKFQSPRTLKDVFTTTRCASFLLRRASALGSMPLAIMSRMARALTRASASDIIGYAPIFVSVLAHRARIFVLDPRPQGPGPSAAAVHAQRKPATPMSVCSMYGCSVGAVTLATNRSVNMRRMFKFPLHPNLALICHVLPRLC